MFKFQSMKLPNCLILNIIFLFATELAYPFTLSGIVYDSNQERLNNALVVLSDNAMHNTKTDSNGEFLIQNINNEICTIKISHIGFESHLAQINLNEIAVLEVSLTTEMLDLDRIVVTGTRSERHIKETPILTHVIGRDDIRNSTYSNVKDMLEIAMPNVENVSSNHGDNRIKIQGLDNKYLAFLVDGDRVSGEYAGNIDFSMLGLSNVEKIEIVEGAMSILYGSSAMGGVINVITKKNTEPYWIDLSVQHNTPLQNSESMNVGFNKKIVNYNLNIQNSHTDGYDLSSSTPTTKTLEENKSMIFNHTLGLNLSEKHNLKITYKDYSSEINTYQESTDPQQIGELIFDDKLKRYSDRFCKIKYDYAVSSNRRFKFSYINEKYIKYSLFTDYYPLDWDNRLEEFKNAIFHRSEANLQYNVKGANYNRIFGIEIFDDDYASFNILGDEVPRDGIYDDIIAESIFSRENSTKNDYSLSLYGIEERTLDNNNILSFGLRILDEDILIPSASYLMKKNTGYNYRFSYSSGYRKPSIKELYYDWDDHPGTAIYGNPNLKPSRNNYISFSLDKRTDINDFSIDFYRNDIEDMISTQMGENSLHYQNYDEVTIDGLNIHYYRKITEKLKLRFVYNLTDASSDSQEILEGISKHALKVNLDYAILDRIRIITSIKYSGKKTMFNQLHNSIKELASYWISDIYMVTSFNNIIFKIGVKNIFDYKDPNRLTTDILNNYDPGRRTFVELKLKFKGKNNE